MHYKCVDVQGPNKRIQVDLIDIIEDLGKSLDGSMILDTSASGAIKQSQSDLFTPRVIGQKPVQPKQRSLIYFKVHKGHDEPDESQEAEEIQEIASGQKFTSFE